jgi:hypothetical protein
MALSVIASIFCTVPRRDLPWVGVIAVADVTVVPGTTYSDNCVTPWPRPGGGRWQHGQSRRPEVSYQRGFQSWHRHIPSHGVMDSDVT